MAVGSFTKSTSTGTQSFAHGLGTIPSAYILFTSAKTAAGITADVYMAMGFTDGTTSRAVSSASDHAVGFSMNCSRRQADKVLSVCEWGETVLYECDHDSWDATNITVDWTTNNAKADIIFFIAFGDSVDAKVVGWDTNTSTGDQSITGVGFQASCAVSIWSQADSTTVPTTVQHAGFGIGATDGSTQGCTVSRSIDGSFLTNCDGVYRTDSCIVGWDSSGNAIDMRATHSSFDADGWTLNWATAFASSRHICSLFLSGIDVDFVNFQKSTETVSLPDAQSVTTAISPEAVLSFSRARGASSGSTNDNFQLYIGAADGSAECSIGARDLSGGTGSNSYRSLSTTRGLELNEDTNDPLAIRASADVSFSGSDVIYTWQSNYSNDVEIWALAFGAEVPPGITPSVSAGPTVDYGDWTRAGANNTPWGLAFTPSDTDTTGVDALTWQVRTASGGAGTLVASGTCTHNVPVSTTIAYNASGLVNGNQTLYLRLSDGSLASDTAFTLKRDDDAPDTTTSIEVTAV